MYESKCIVDLKTTVYRHGQQSVSKVQFQRVQNHLNAVTSTSIFIAGKLALDPSIVRSRTNSRLMNGTSIHVVAAYYHWFYFYINTISGKHERYNRTFSRFPSRKSTRLCWAFRAAGYKNCFLQKDCTKLLPPLKIIENFPFSVYIGTNRR